MNYSKEILIRDGNLKYYIYIYVYIYIYIFEDKKIKII